MKAYLEPEEIALMENAATNLRDRLLVRLPFRLGCRISEALALEVKHIDFETGTATIEHLKSRIRLDCPHCCAGLGRSHEFCPKCGHKVTDTVKKELEHRRMRTLPIDTETLDILKDYIERGGPVTKNGKTLLFGINRHRAWQIIRDLAKKAGLPELVNPETGKTHGVSPHKLRDAFAVNAVKRDDTGDGLRLLQEHLGHSSFNTTAKYRKVSGRELRDWYEKLWDKDSA
jgi:integrase/recombinase XerD